MVDLFYEPGFGDANDSANRIVCRRTRRVCRSGTVPGAHDPRTLQCLGLQREDVPFPPTTARHGKRTSSSTRNGYRARAMAPGRFSSVEEAADQVVDLVEENIGVRT